MTDPNAPAKVWRIRLHQNGGWNGGPTKYLAIQPGCPFHAHAQRHCKCRTFIGRAAAQRYIDEQIATARDGSADERP